MKMFISKKTTLLAGVLAIIFWGNNLWAEVPLNNLEGVGGIAFNPLAYLAGKNVDKSKSQAAEIFSKPQFGGWYVHLSDVSVDWTTFGAAESFFKRVEFSYGHEVIAISDGPNIHKDNVGGKFLIIKENAANTKFIPAVSAGVIWKRTNQVGEGLAQSAPDFYLVASKLITQTPKPILLSGGLLSTRGLVTGVFGYDKDRKETGFANIDLIPVKNLAVGFEFKQGAQFDDFKNADYYDIHAALFYKSLTLVGAYVYAGDHTSQERVGLGKGLVLSAHYQF
jgi:hypothetical protein